MNLKACNAQQSAISAWMPFVGCCIHCTFHIGEQVVSLITVKIRSCRNGACLKPLDKSRQKCANHIERHKFAAVLCPPISENK